MSFGQNREEQHLIFLKLKRLLMQFCLLIKKEVLAQRRPKIVKWNNKQPYKSIILHYLDAS
jgi:hypothetical protein